MRDLTTSNCSLFLAHEGGAGTDDGPTRHFWDQAQPAHQRASGRNPRLGPVKAPAK